MKPTGYIGILLLLSSLAVVAEEPRVQLERETGKLSATLLYNDWQQHFAEKEFAAGRTQIEAELRKEPARWVKIAEARKYAEQLFAAELHRQYRQAAEKLLAPFADDVDAATLKKWSAGNETWFKARMQNLFPASFQQVRNKLAKEQRSRVFRKCYPTPIELEAHDDTHLRILLQNRFRTGAGEVLWEENERLLLAEVIDPAIAAGRAMQKRQLELVARTPLPPTLWDVQEAEKTLRAVVQQEIAKRPPEEGTAIFPATEKALIKRAAGLLEERVSAAFPATADREAYAAAVAADWTKHRLAAESFNLVQPEITDSLIREAVQKSAVPPDRRQEACDSTAIRQSAERHFQQKIVPQLQQERNRLADAQLEQYWPELKRDWSPEPEAVETYSAGGMQNLPELQDYPASKPLLAETVQLMEPLIRKHLASECLRLEKQHLSVHQQYDTVLAALLQEQQNKRASWLADWFGGSDLSLDKIVAEYRKKVESADNGVLFPEVLREIEVRSRAILQLLQEAPTIRKDSPEPPLPMVTLEITLREKNGKYQLQFENWSREFPMEESPLPVQELTQALSRRISAEKTPSQFTIRLAVGEGRIYYHTVAELREALRRAIGGRIEDQILR